MRASFILAGLTAFVLAASSLLPRAAFAADLDGESYVEPDDDGDYMDERYPPPRYSEAPNRYRDEAYDERGDMLEDRPGSIKDGYPVPMPPPRAHARPPERFERYACLDRWQIKRRLRGEGWAGIRPMGGDGTIVNIRARRFESGRPFHLRVDRCTGDVIAARPHDVNYVYGAYGERRWDRRW